MTCLIDNEANASVHVHAGSERHLLFRSEHILSVKPWLFQLKNIQKLSECYLYILRSGLTLSPT